MSATSSVKYMGADFLVRTHRDKITEVRIGGKWFDVLETFTLEFRRSLQAAYDEMPDNVGDDK